MSIGPESSILTGQRHTVSYVGDTGDEATASVHVLDHGDPTDPAVILLSGLALAWFDWQDVTLALGNDHRVLVLDRAGSGLSGPAPFSAGSSLADEVEVVCQILDQYGIERATIAGHSMGGLIAEALGRRHPDRCEAIVLLDTSYEDAKDSDWPDNPPPGDRGEQLDEPRSQELPDTGSMASLRERLAAANVPLPALTELMTRQARSILTSSPTVARLVAAIRTHTKGAPLASAKRADELRVSRAVFTRKHILEGMVREYRSYDAWITELEELRKATRMPVPWLIVAARGNPKFVSDRWVRKLERLADGLRAENPDVSGRFEVVRASHMLMRDVPDEVAALIVDPQGTP
ncbi:MAG: alpha/beta hydrolase [Actinomycetaceae bacterium]|nr:alpha/beta hydrolase [Actinomycetaceae bacterium]